MKNFQHQRKSNIQAFFKTASGTLSRGKSHKKHLVHDRMQVCAPTQGFNSFGPEEGNIHTQLSI